MVSHVDPAISLLDNSLVCQHYIFLKLYQLCIFITTDDAFNIADPSSIYEPST